jgi:hypothetical protein
MIEHWRPCPGFKLYEVSDRARVRRRSSPGGLAIFAAIRRVSLYVTTRRPLSRIRDLAYPKNVRLEPCKISTHLDAVL